MRETVGRLTPYNHAMPAPDMRPDTTLSAISVHLATASFFRLPPMHRSALAAARPADVRSRIMARLNSAKAPTNFACSLEQIGK
jgi:hypothetical protein